VFTMWYHRVLVYSVVAEDSRVLSYQVNYCCHSVVAVMMFLNLSFFPKDPEGTLHPRKLGNFPFLVFLAF